MTKKIGLLSTIAILLSCGLYFHFGYTIIREDFLQLFGSYVALFLFFLFLIKQNLDFKTYTIIGILFRAVFLFSIPILSQDFYRFIWDGRMILNGFNPYLYLPENYLTPDYIVPDQAAELYAGMGKLNASHYTNYPPLNQLCFLIAALFSKHSIIGSVIVFRVILILADIGVYYYGRKLLEKLQLNPKAILLYFLNPFIILELTGNLHFEGLMIFFLVYALYLLQQKKWILAALLIGCSISLKLIPLLFLPLFFQQFKLKKLIGFYSIVIGTVIVSIIPFISEVFIANYSRTVGLWFGQFEFNGSLHNIAKVIDHRITGYNSIKSYIIKVTPLLVVIVTLLITFFRKNKTKSQLITAMLLTFGFYLATSTTVHPWYLSMLLVLCLFTPYRFPLVWTFTIMLTYETYSNPFFQENFWLLGIEYTIAYGYFIWEFVMLKRKPNSAWFRLPLSS
ncbi:MAG: DUF2029 domain-containing protein [Flavobacteriaceae bacterium]|nr:DUF2029 domain-containing protein [Flavobacteriaceae bacterium]